MYALHRLFPKNVNPQTFIGLMSGTSVDSVDACCSRFWVKEHRFHFEIVGFYTQDIPSNLRERLLACMQNQPVLLEELCILNTQVGELFAEAVWGLLNQCHLQASEIEGIGSHGQTVFHLPPRQKDTLGSTLQIGDPCLIAERTGITTVADFRPRDMAAGGQGAPLVCFADALLFGNSPLGRGIQNIGGIANVTVLPVQGEPFAFDTGPGNMLIDKAMVHFFNQPYDENGHVAAQGILHPDLLEVLLAHPFLKKQPPKTTGREDFGWAYFDSLLAQFPGMGPQDWIATLTLYTAKTIVEAYRQFVFPKTSIGEMVIGGGGLYNQTLLNHLQTLFQEAGYAIEIRSHEDFGIPSKYKEALAFALLGWATLNRIPNNVPSCTGASRSVILGKIIPA